MSSSHQRGLWTPTALATAAVAVAVTIGFVWKQQQQQQQQQRRNNKASSDDDGIHPKGSIHNNSSSRDEEKKEMEELVVGQQQQPQQRRPVLEISTSSSTSSEKLRILTKGVVTIVHASVTGSCAKLSKQLEASLKESLPPEQTVQVGTMEDFDWWDEFLNDEADDNNKDQQASSKSKNLSVALPKLIILLPTYTSGSWPPSATTLQSTFSELLTDWRIEKFPLKKKIHVGIFGMGSSAYGDDTMGKPAREAQMHLHKLGAKTIVRLAIGDDSVGDHAQTTFSKWASDLISQIQKFDGSGSSASSKKSMTKKKKGTSSAAVSSSSCCGNNLNDDGGDCGQKEDKRDSGEATVITQAEQDEGSYNDDDDSDQEAKDDPSVIDLEDMGDVIMASTESNNNDSTNPPEMVTPSQAAALKKEGYKLIGTHSAVKLCRWTKHQLRGRGGCYKHTFYGITSYQCMEATPSLACANKCVFCWRHHKNPVGKEWRWKTDDPHFIVDEAVKTHVMMIKEAKGIPGVRMDRWNEALTVRHCALSLVGEPIMYPRIDELLSDLHSRKISTFLVTNGQHPLAIESLRPVTQLYVSVDAPTQESLIAIDRPLFQDAWDRLKQSLVSLKDKGQRTVARLTVVKGWNSDEVEGYAKLIALGNVSLVEVKGVTFCGKSDASNLNMSNTPWHHEVIALTTTLKEELDKLRKAEGPESTLPEYGLACEHKHSCSVLLARVDQFAYDDPVTGSRKWRTWIDYDKFLELARRHAEDPLFTFSVEDYVADTPPWALMGADEEGFDPTDTRHRKKTKYPKFTQFDENGVPTHDQDNKELSTAERNHLLHLMEERKNEIGCGSTVTQMKDGAKEIQDASLMFRGLVITK